MMTVEQSVAILNGLDYLVQNIWQRDYGGWVVCIRSPYNWDTWTTEGATLAEAADKAATAAKGRGQSKPLTKAEYLARETARRPKRKPATKRVRLTDKPKRVRL